MPYVVTNQNLPRSLDVQISLSRPQTETRTNLSIPVAACEDLGLFPDANRLRFYSTLSAVETDFAPGTEAHFAASAFFAQSPRPPTMAIGQVFLDPQPAVLVAGILTEADITALKEVTVGGMEIVFNADGQAVATRTYDNLDFSGADTLEDIAAVIGTDIALTTSVKTLPGGAKRLIITVSGTGDGVTIGYATDAETEGVTFVGGLLRLTAATGGHALNGYTPTGIADELSSIQGAANAVGKYLYGWVLGASLRTAAIQEAAAVWAGARTVMMPLVTNDPNAKDPAYTTDIGSVIGGTGNKNAPCLYHDNAQRYPDMSILAYMLSVNYQVANSTVTAKFKVLPGVETVALTETEWTALQAKGYNTYTAIGNSARTYRDGTTEEEGWFMDTTINLANFVEDLSVNVYNVFLRNRKVPYTRAGQALLVEACRDTGYQYEYNGTFADREVQDLTTRGGTKIVPAVQVIPTPISQMSAASRAGRIGPPIEMIVQEAGAIHSIAVNVEVVS